MLLAPYRFVTLKLPNVYGYSLETSFSLNENVELYVGYDEGFAVGLVVGVGEGKGVGLVGKAVGKRVGEAVAMTPPPD
jgi:hypothetical protein